MAKRRRPRFSRESVPLPAEYEPDGWPPGFSFDREKQLVIERTNAGDFLRATPAEESSLMAPWLALRAAIGRGKTGKHGV